MFHGQVAYGHEVLMGQPLVQGATGGQACYMSTDGRGDGGFGAGGGGCTGGGGGGGFSGGSVITSNTSNGDGGYSYLDSTKTIPNLSEAISGYHAGDGMILIIPAVSGCGCDHRCVALDARKSQVTCICPDTWKLDEDGKSCVRKYSPGSLLPERKQARELFEEEFNHLRLLPDNQDICL